MNREDSPNDPRDALLDRLLRDDAAAQSAVADDGFTDRLLLALPPRPRPRDLGWLPPAAALLACALVLLVTPAGVALAEALLGFVAQPTLSWSLVWLALPLAVFYGSLMELLRED